MPITRGPNVPTAEERFWPKVKVGRPDECWAWRGKKDRSGPRPSKVWYGRFLFRGRLDPSHRVAWVFANGEIPVGMKVLHRCDNSLCVNPAHLWVGTQADNTRDMVAKGRNSTARGERNAWSRFTTDRVRAIRRAAKEYGLSANTLAYLVGTTPSHIQRILNRESWKHVR